MRVSEDMSTLEGFDEFIDLCSDMKIEDEEVAVVLKRTLSIPKDRVKKNAPKLSGLTKKSIKIKVKKNPFGGCTGTIYLNNFQAMFQEFRNVRQSGKHIGWFERSIRESEDDFVQSLRVELIDRKMTS